MFSVLVAFDDEPDTIAALCDLAEARGVKVGQLVHDLAAAAVAPPAVPPRPQSGHLNPREAATLRTKIKTLHADGLTNSEIAQRTGYRLTQVNGQMKRLGLTPHRNPTYKQLLANARSRETRP